jgi:hypothetical protein
MKTCGVEIKASEAIFALASLDGNSVTHVPLTLKKLALEDDEVVANVHAFARQAAAFVAEHGIQRLAIKKRSKKGEFAGGPTTFKIEGILQLLDGCETVLVSPQTISAQARKSGAELPSSLNKYQHDAFKAASAVLLKR